MGKHRARGRAGLSMAAGALAAALTRRTLTTLWRIATGRKPPKDLTAQDVSRREATAWAVLSGAVLGGAKAIAVRRAASYYERSTSDSRKGRGSET
jgi:hypothetical protein